MDADLQFRGLACKHDHKPTLLRTLTIAGLPGYVSIDRGRVLQTTALELRDGRIVVIYIMRNPDKLRHVAAMLDARQIGGQAGVNNPNTILR